MLPRAHRLTSGRGFALAVRRGRRLPARTLVVHLWQPGSEGSDPAGAATPALAPASTPAPASTLAPAATQVGFVVSKAVGNAVDRNRVKRRLRAQVAERLDRLPAGSVVAVRALPAAGSASSLLLGRDLDRALDRLASSPTGARR